MKRLLLLLFLTSISLNAQTHRFIYDLIYRPDSASTEVRKTNYYLDINPKESFYYERPFFVSDSIEKASGRRIFSGKPSDLLSKNLKTRQYVLYSIQSFDIYQLKDTPQISWKIEKGNQNFLLSTTSKGNRQIRRKALDGLVFYG